MASAPDAPFSSDFHRPGTFRGGFVAHLQGLLALLPDGTFTPPDSIRRAGPAPVPPA